ncbi:TolC family protein [Amorphus sp. MBR-141]
MRTSHPRQHRPFSTTSAEAGQGYVSLRGAQKQLAIARHSVELQNQKKSYGLSRQQEDGGTASKFDLARPETQLGNTQSQIPMIEAQVEQAMGQLAVLCGLEPGELDKSLAKPRPIPSRPKPVMVGDPAGLLRRRPDIRRAEPGSLPAMPKSDRPSQSIFQRSPLSASARARRKTSETCSRRFTQCVWRPVSPVECAVFRTGRCASRGAKGRVCGALTNYRQVVLAALQDAESSLSEFRRCPEM